MKRLILILMLAVLLCFPVTVLADSWKYSLPVYVEWLNLHYPDATGASASWNGTYTSIDDNWKNYDDTDFIQTSTDGACASFLFTDWSGNVTVNQVVVVTRAKKVYAGDDIELFYRESGINYSQDSLSPSGSFERLSKTFTTNPATGASWNITSINSMEWGVKKTGTDGNVYVSQIYVKVIPSTIEGASSLSNFALIANLNIQSIINNGFLSSDALDTEFGDLSTYSYTPVNDRLPFFVDSISAYEMKVNNFRLGYSPPKTSFDFVVGQGGYVTIDDDPSIELSDNFTIELKGYINTILGSNKYLVYKPNAFRTYISANYSITSAIWDVEYGTWLTSVTATNVLSGEHVVITTANTTDLMIYIDGVLRNITTLNSANVTDNNNDWVIMQNGSIVYLEYMKVNK